MKWQPQDVIAVMLASIFVIMVIKGFVVDTMDLHPEPMTKEEVDFWEDPINMIIGGLIAYMATRRRRDSDEE